MNRTVDSRGTVRYWNSNGEIHRLDGPAVIEADGRRIWRYKDLTHRKDGPAVIGPPYFFPNGDIEVYLEYFEDGHFQYQLKKTIFANRIQYRNTHGKLHRLDGPAVIFMDGRQYWYESGYWHRENGPAEIHRSIMWAKHGILHRLNGLAVIDMKQPGISYAVINGKTRPALRRP